MRQPSRLREAAGRRGGDLRQLTPDPSVAELLPIELCLEKLVVVLGKLPADRDEAVAVGMVHVRDDELKDDLRRRLDRAIEPIQLSDWEVRRSLAIIHGLPPTSRGISVHLSAGRTIDFSPELAVSRVLNDVLSVAVDRGATDLHLELYHEGVDVRLRIDGSLRTLGTPITPENIVRVVSRLKILAGLDPIEHRHTQDGHFSAIYEDGDGGRRRVDFRVAIVPGELGEDTVVRVVDPDRFHLALDELGMEEALLARFRRLVGYPNGLILVAGPTVAGKTNTLYATLAHLRERGGKIVTVEDPIEYDFPHITQKNVSPDMGFSDFIRAFMRQNPDVILVGEVRDRETAETVVQAATTGHLVLSSVHTRDAVGSVARLRGLGVSDDALSDVVVAVLGQRLLARICEACKEQTIPSPELIAAYYVERPGHPFFHGRGCEACQDTGYHGLTGIFELLEIGDHLRGGIARGVGTDELGRIAERDPAFTPLVAQALARVADGVTSLEEVSRRLKPVHRTTGADKAARRKPAKKGAGSGRRRQPSKKSPAAKPGQKRGDGS